MVVKILFIVSYYLPYLSGLTIYAANLAEELARSNNQISILTTQFDKQLLLEENLKGVNVGRVPIILKLSKGFIMPKYFFQAFKSVSKSEMVVIHLPQLEGATVAILAKLLKKKLVIIYHCDINLPSGLTNKLITGFLHTANLMALTLSTKVVTQTRDYADNSWVLTRFKNKLVPIYPPIPTPIIDQSLKLKLIKSLPKTKYRIGFIGRMASEKGIEYLLEAIPLLEKKLGKNFLILMAGPRHPVGEEKYQQKILNLVKKYQQFVYFVDPFPIGSTGTFYSLLDVLVLPSVNSTEAFGMVQVEAMLMGVSVIASDLPGVRIPIQKTGMGVLVKPKDPEDLSNKIIKVVLNKNKYQKSRVKILKIFGLEKSLESYLKLFQSL